MQDHKRAPLLSLEGTISLAAGFYLGLAEITWEQRAIGVFVTSLLIVDMAGRVARRISIKVLIATGCIGILLNGTWTRIWQGFQQSFPTAATDPVLFRIIIVAGIVAFCIAGYTFVIRPWGKEGYRMLPAQLIAFGISTVGIGLLIAVVGLGWQFQQNWSRGTKPSGAPSLPSSPSPQLPHTSPPAALPPPQPGPTPMFSGYNLTNAGVGALANELYKMRGSLPAGVPLEKMSTYSTSGALVDSIFRACDEAGLNCPINNVHPNSPTDRGPMIFVQDPNKPPEAAQRFHAALQGVDISAPFTARPGLDPAAFALFVGPAPK